MMALPSKGLVLHLPMREGAGTFASDASRYHNDGALTGGKWVENGIEFNGSSDYIDCGNDANLNITDAITISAIINPTTLNDHRYILHKREATKGWYLLNGAVADDEFLFVVKISGTSYIAETNTALHIGKWTHITGTYDGSVVKIYVNGVEQSTSVNVIGNMETTSTNLEIGARAGSGHINGSISDVRIYNRALSAAEIYDYYESTKHNYV